MMHQMGPGMMSGPDASLIFWIVLAVILALLLIAACTLLVINWLKNQQRARMQAGPQPRDASMAYEQGYRPQQLAETETYQEGGRHYSYPHPQYEPPQDEQPQIQHSRQ